MKMNKIQSIEQNQLRNEKTERERERERERESMESQQLNAENANH